MLLANHKIIAYAEISMQFTSCAALCMTNISQCSSGSDKQLRIEQRADVVHPSGPAQRSADLICNVSHHHLQYSVAHVMYKLCLVA